MGYHYNPPSHLVSGPTTSYSGASYSLERGFEEIIDDYPSTKDVVNDVTHKSALTVWSRIDNYDETSSLGDRYVTDGPLAHQHSWGQYGELNHSAVSVQWPTDGTSLVRKALHEFHNENKVDNLLNLVELPQLLPTLRSMGAFLKTAKNLPLLLTPAKAVVKGSRRRLGKEFLKGSANTHLGYSFGLAPLVSDMNKMYRAMPTIRRLYVDAQRECHDIKTIRARATGKLSLIIPDGIGYSYTPNIPSGNKWTIPGVSQIVPPIQIVVLRGRRDRPKYYSSTLQALDGFLRNYVTGGPASALWEHLPFSFVVDWFVDLSGVIDKLNESLTGLSSQVISLSSSQKWHVEYDIQKIPTLSWPSSTSDWTLTAHSTLKYYHRESTLPPPLVGASSRFGKKQLALSASLLHNIVANLRAYRKL